MDDFFEDGFGEDFYEDGFEGEFEDFDDGGFEEGDYGSDYEERFFNENFNYDGDDDSTGFEDEHLSREEQQADEGWISPEEASILGYGFGYEEGRAERRRRRQLRQDARIERFRRNRRHRRNRYDDDSEIF